MKPLWNVNAFCNRTSWKVSDVQIVRKTWVLSVSLSLSLSLSLCVVCCALCVVCCVLCVVCCPRDCGCGGGGGRERKKEGERPLEPSGC